MKIWMLAFSVLTLQGITERSTDTVVRPILTGVQAGVPDRRGPFVFAAPYGTQGYRLTDATDCTLAVPDCVQSVGYSYWPNAGAHAGDLMYVFATLRGAGGPTLFTINTRSHVVTKVGALFTDARLQAESGEGWYFSRTRPTTLYVVPAMTRALQRLDVVTKTTESVFDITAQFPGHFIWQVSTSRDDAVHAFSLRLTSTYAIEGCAVYIEPTKAWRYFPAIEMDECQIDQSGRWLLIKSQVDGTYGEDNRLINLDTNAEAVLLDQDGAGGHSDNGVGAFLAKDNWSSLPSIRVWRWGTSPVGPGLTVYRNPTWESGSVGHISWTHAGPYACGSNADRINGPRSNEVVCFRTDGSLRALTVAPVMSTPDTGSAGNDSYKNAPKGNLDPTGEYFVWSTNLGTPRLDVVAVRVPWADRVPQP